MNSQAASLAIILPAFFLMVTLVVTTGITALQRNRRLRALADLHQRLFDRLGSVRDFTEFAQTDAGRQLLQSLSVDSAGSVPRDRVLRAAELGIVAVFLGVGLVTVGKSFAFEARDAVTAAGIIAVSVGLGYLVSALVLFRFSRSKELL